MTQQAPNLYNRAYSTKPPVALVMSWLVMSKKKEVNAYTRQRAIDLIMVIFGSVEFAERYVHVHTEKFTSSPEHAKIALRLHN